MPLAAFCKSIRCKHMGTHEVHSNHNGDYGPGTGLMDQTICKLTNKTPRQTKQSECKKRDWMNPPNQRRVACCAACEHGVGPLKNALGTYDGAWGCTQFPHRIFHPSELCDLYEDD